MNKMKYSMVLIIALIIFMAAIIPAGTALAAQTGVVKGGWLILRSEPSFNSAIKSSYPTGTVVTITGLVGSWYSVKAPDGLTGYMLGDYLQINGDGSVQDSTIGYVVSANGLNVRMRSGPGKGYSIIAAYAPGTQ